jgi:hypothetical protein
MSPSRRDHPRDLLQRCLLTAGLVATTCHAQIERRQEAGSSSLINRCHIEYEPDAYIIHQVKPVYISTYIEQNLLLTIDGGITIDITNAPTDLVTTVTATNVQTSLPPSSPS